ncbi:lipopolysaccharide biosynthesis protein [Rhizosphaericola mali]|uniref:Oligosaccharide flippase family protein n=1 Tax=Rhizosphaericola mali TaxID=2545455 RepID=A0A5P2G1R1_9BACT|nr:oligosaccharide flippase family protein [Rhizosphaericola mali]QES87772.1 oligosaccharide flippase family protein [Rhizosphaericola mali]
MSKIKQLASQTVWYGASNIAAKLLNYLLTPFLTRVLHTEKGMVDFGDFSLLYSCIAILNIIFTYGFETAYFRFSNKPEVNKETLLRTAFGSMVMSTIGLSLILIGLRYPLSRFVEQVGHPEYITYSILIVAFDTLAVIPFARLRQENKPKRYAFVNVSGVFINVLLTVLFVGVLPKYAESHPGTFLANWYNAHTTVQLLLYANIAQAVFAFVLLYPQWRGVKIKINKPLWRDLFIYSSPMIITGLGGMINETMDRVMLVKWMPGGLEHAKLEQSIYSANYKLSIIISLFIQAFRMAAEPFFFSQSQDKQAPKLYARVMKWFVIVVCCAFLVTMLYLDIWKLIVGPSYRSGLGVVPILLLANIFLGVYYNQSVWYKLTNKMRSGMYITLIGAMITLVINYMFIPRFGMYASAWATFFCYGSMMVISYFWGHKYFPIPYNVKKLSAYVIVMLILFFIQNGIMHLINSSIVHLITGTILMVVFLGLIVFAERKEISSFPVIGKYIQKYLVKI